MAKTQTLTKMDMIKELIATNSVDEFKKEKDDTVKLASRLFRQLSADKVQALYAERITSAPEEVIEEVTQKVEEAAAPTPTPKKAAKKAKTEDEEYNYSKATDKEGNEYAKAWVLELLDATKFGALSASKKTRTLECKSNKLIYNRIDNTIQAVSKETNKKVKKTMAICPFIVKAFIKKYAV